MPTLPGMFALRACRATLRTRHTTATSCIEQSGAPSTGQEEGAKTDESHKTTSHGLILAGFATNG